MNLDDEATKTRIERNKMRAALHRIADLVHADDLTIEGIVRNVEQLAEYAEEVTARMNAAHAETLAFRALFRTHDNGSGLRFTAPRSVDDVAALAACSVHDARIKAESEAF